MEIQKNHQRLTAYLEAVRDYIAHGPGPGRLRGTCNDTTGPLAQMLGDFLAFSARHRENPLIDRMVAHIPAWGARDLGERVAHQAAVDLDREFKDQNRRKPTSPTDRRGSEVRSVPFVAGNEGDETEGERRNSITGMIKRLERLEADSPGLYKAIVSTEVTARKDVVNTRRDFEALSKDVGKVERWVESLDATLLEHDERITDAAEQKGLRLQIEAIQEQYPDRGIHPAAAESRQKDHLAGHVRAGFDPKRPDGIHHDADGCPEVHVPADTERIKIHRNCPDPEGCATHRPPEIERPEDQEPCFEHRTFDITCGNCHKRTHLFRRARESKKDLTGIALEPCPWCENTGWQRAVVRNCPACNPDKEIRR